MFKKAQRSLQMIFGIFVLLIITLVVIGIFLRTAEKGTGELLKN